MQLKDIFSASSDGVSQPSNSTLRFKQKALAATILATLAIIAFIAVEASDTKPARKAPTEAAMITLRPDGTDKDVLIARYDANFLALSRRIEEVQREAAATETRLRAIIADQKSRLETQTSEVKDLKAIAGRAGLTPRPGETPEETEARIKSLLKANDDAAYISKLSSQFGSKTPGKVFHTDPAKDLTSDDVTSDQAKQLLGNVAAEGVETTMKVDEGMYNEGFIIDSEAKVHSTGPNSVMQSTLELATIAPLALNRILTNDVHKRMGDIRSMKQTSGAWARYDGGRLSAESGLENDFHTIQVGVDTVPTAGAPRFGVAFSYTMSDADYRRGKADMDVYSLAAYGLWMGENGQFADVVARLGTAKTDMTVDGNKKGSMDNIVTALSGEFGWRFDLSKSFYLEPQVELAYTHVDADVLSLSDGSTYRFDDADSLMGRAGFAFGMRCPENGNTAYLRVSAVHEFLGDNTVIGGNGKVYDIDGKDTWVEYGLGANFNLTDSTYVWADVERTSGGYLDEDWRATVGVRHAF